MLSVPTTLPDDEPVPAPDEIVQPAAPAFDWAEANAAIHSFCRMAWRQFFGPCGQNIWPNDPTAPQPTQAFNNPDAVRQKLVLNDLQRKYIVAFSAVDESGNWNPNISTKAGYIWGDVKFRSKLPAFNITIQVNGQLHKRLILPQSTSTSSMSAGMARRGAKIAWMLEDWAKDDPRHNDPNQSPYRLKIVPAQGAEGGVDVQVCNQRKKRG